MCAWVSLSPLPVPPAAFTSGFVEFGSLRSHREVRPCGICLPLFDSFHFAYRTQGRSVSSHVQGFLLSWTSLFKPASLSPTDNCSSLTPALLSSIASTFWLTLGLRSSAVFSPWHVNCDRLHGLFCPLPCAQGLKECPHVEGLMLAADLCFPHLLVGRWAHCCKDTSLRGLRHIWVFSESLISKCWQPILILSTQGVRQNPVAW